MRSRLGFFGKLAFLVIIFFLVISIVNLNIEINALNKENEKLEAQYQSYSYRVERLHSQLDEEVTEETIKRIAREKLNLRDPGDIAYANDLPN